MDTFLSQLPPLMAIVIVGGGIAMTWLARLVLILLKESREDRGAYVNTVKEATAAVRDSTSAITAMRDDFKQLSHSIEMMGQIVSKTFSDQRADAGRR